MNTMLFDRIFSVVSARLIERFPPISARRFVVGLSGGADSTALLYLLDRMRQMYGICVFAVHVNHGLRGEDSDADERFCVSLCAKLGIELFVRHIEGLKHGLGLEACARDKRYACMRDVCQEVQADALLTAHHAQDQAETLLMHLMRGSGVHGLGAIREVSMRDGVVIARPLLGVTRADIEALQITHREDQTNFIPDNLRNALRLTVMPQLEQMAPGTARRLAQTAMIAQKEDEWMDLIAQEKITHPAYLSLDDLKPMHPALLRRVLRLFANSGIDSHTTLAMEALIYDSPGAKVNLPRGEILQRGYRYICIKSRLKPIVAEIECNVRRDDMGWGDGKRTQVIPYELFRQARFRTRRQGDFIRPFGMTGRKTMQDYFVDKKTDEFFRDMVPILCLDDEVLWIPGLGASQSLRASPQTPGVFLTARHPMPWLIEKEGANR